MFLQGLSKNFHMVLGDCDRIKDLQTKKKIDVNGVKIGMLHGHNIIPWDDVDALRGIEREIECDILLHGATHKLCTRKLGKSYAVNPGSATGAFSSLEV